MIIKWNHEDILSNSIEGMKLISDKVKEILDGDKQVDPMIEIQLVSIMEQQKLLVGMYICLIKIASNMEKKIIMPNLGHN